MSLWYSPSQYFGNKEKIEFSVTWLPNWQSNQSDKRSLASSNKTYKWEPLKKKKKERREVSFRITLQIHSTSWKDAMFNRCGTEQHQPNFFGTECLRHGPDQTRSHMCFWNAGRIIYLCVILEWIARSVALHCHLQGTQGSVNCCIQPLQHLLLIWVSSLSKLGFKRLNTIKPNYIKAQWWGKRWKLWKHLWEGHSLTV